MFDDWLNTYRPLLEKRDFEVFLKLVDRGQAKINPEWAIQAVYASLRKHSYDISDPAIGARYDQNIENITGADTEKIRVKNEGGWHYRIPKNHKDRGWDPKSKALQVISINAYAEPELIAKLDDFCTSHKAYYKVSEQLAGWQERHDSVNIYFHEPVNDEIRDKVKLLAAKHTRAGLSIGEELAHGINLENSPQKEEAEALIARAEKLHPDLGKEVRKRSYKKNPLKMEDPPKLVLSVGEKLAIEKVLDSYEKFVRFENRLAGILRYGTQAGIEFKTMLAQAEKNAPDSAFVKLFADAGLSSKTIESVPYEALVKHDLTEKIKALGNDHLVIVHSYEDFMTSSFEDPATKAGLQELASCLFPGVTIDLDKMAAHTRAQIQHDIKFYDERYLLVEETKAAEARMLEAFDKLPEVTKVPISVRDTLTGNLANVVECNGEWPTTVFTEEVKTHKAKAITLLKDLTLEGSAKEARDAYVALLEKGDAMALQHRDILVRLYPGEEQLFNDPLESVLSHYHREALPQKPAIPPAIVPGSKPETDVSGKETSLPEPEKPRESMVSRIARTEEKAAEKSHNGWLIGGIAAATAIIGAVLYYRNKNKNHAGQEAERRQAQNNPAQSAVR